MGTFLDYLNEIEKNPNFFKQKKVVTESSLSRLWKHHIEHPCGTISAFRNEYTKQENLERTEQLRLRIGVCGYAFTKIQGKYIETNDDGAKKNVSEISFIVYDLFDQEDSLLDDLLRWGEFFNQDSITFARAGEDFYLYGTTKRLGADPKYHQKRRLGAFKGGKIGDFGFSSIRGRPFVFDKIIEEHV